MKAVTRAQRAADDAAGKARPVLRRARHRLARMRQKNARGRRIERMTQVVRRETQKRLIRMARLRGLQ